MTSRFASLAVSCLLIGFALRAEEPSGDSIDRAKENDRPVLKRVEYLTEKKKSADKAYDGFVDHFDIQERALQQVVDYLSQVGGVKILLQTEDLKKIVISTEGWSQGQVNWRQVLDAICKEHKLRIDDSRLKDEKIVVVWKPEMISFTYKDADIRDVLFTIAAAGKLNIVIDPEVQGKVTATLKDVPCPDALEVIAKSLGYVVVHERGTFRMKNE